MLLVTQKDTAEALRLGVGGGFVSASDAIRWADHHIQQSAAPHPGLFEISLANPARVGEVDDALRAVPGEPHPTAVFYLVLALLDESHLSFENCGGVMQLLWQLALAGYYPDYAVYHEICTLDDGWYLAVERTYGSVVPLHQHLVAFHSVFRTPGLRGSILDGSLGRIPALGRVGGAAA